jgi:hypothetical protein
MMNKSEACMRKIHLPLMMVLLLSIANSAGAVGLYIDWGVRDGIAGGRIAGDTWNAQLGAFKVSLGGPDGQDLGLFYCVDLVGRMHLRQLHEYDAFTTNHPDLNQMSPDGYNRGRGAVAAWVYGTYGQNAPDGATAGATQVALWEILYDDDYNLATGNFTVTGYGLGFDYDLAQSIVSSAVGQQSVTAYYRHHDVDVRAQDLIGPVPEPGSILLLGMGLLGSGTLIRRRRRS